MRKISSDIGNVQKFVKKYSFLSFIILFCILVVSCADEKYMHENFSPTTKGGDLQNSVTYIYSDSTENGAIELGNATIQNPYNVDTLRKAFRLRYPLGNPNVRIAALEPTHYQIRFLPKDSVEFDLLDKNGFVTTPIPLDKEIVSGGTSYFDPLLNPEINPYTWQYTIIPVNTPIPDIEYEIIGEIMDIDTETKKSRGFSSDNDFWFELKKTAFQMCGYSENENVLNNPSYRGIAEGDRYSYIEVYDSRLKNYVGAIGAQVVMSGLNYITSSYITGWLGSYLVPKQAIDDPNAKFIIKWENTNWFIINPVANNDNRNIQAVYPFTKQSSIPWVHRIGGGVQEKLAHVTMALNRIYSGNTLDLPRPIKSSRMKVRCVNAYYPSSSVSRVGEYSTVNGVSLWIPGIISRACYNTAIHEMGHAIEDICYGNKSSDWFDESWAELVENYIVELDNKELSACYNITPPITNIKTVTFSEGVIGPPGPPPYKVYNEPTSFNLQQWPFDFKYNLYYKLGTTTLAYTPLLIDLVDTDNQREYHYMYCMQNFVDYSVYKSFPNDEVSGYTLPQIGLALSKLTPDLSLPQLHQFKEIIKTVCPNTPTQKIQIDTLLNKYIYYCETYY